MLRNSRRRQQGMTMLGLVFLLIFIGVFAFGAIRLIPVYLNYMKVIGVVNGVVTEFEGQNANAAAVRRSISRRFDVESVSEIVAKDVKVSPVDGGLQVSATYDHSTPFLSNISFTVHFDKTETVRR
ncbi:MAG: DUF4845 domain-containing protein [Proteobacteria bacterium]|nr:DUF4845 domain-containing protein [Pseudomonadota bacterium]